MIRVPQLPPGTAWSAARPAVANARTATQDPATWFDGPNERLNVCIGGEVSPSARGLTVEQHAARVLMHLCGERDVG
jgi:hypothetical protein